MSTAPMNARPGMHWSAQTRLGKWAVSLAGVALGGTVAVALAFSAGLDHGGSFSDNWIASLAGVAILASAVASVATGLLALFRRHERSWLVGAATTLGALVTALMLQQVAEGLGWLSG